MPGLTLLLVCSSSAHQHPCDGPGTSSPQCAEQLQKPVRAGKGSECCGVPNRWDFSLKARLPHSLCPSHAPCLGLPPLLCV